MKYCFDKKLVFASIGQKHFLVKKMVKNKNNEKKLKFCSKSIQNHSKCILKRKIDCSIFPLHNFSGLSNFLFETPKRSTLAPMACAPTWH